jgi:predicted amino acid-binding ACT domain protein
MSYETVSIVKAVKDMVLTCPFLDDYEVELSPMGFERFTDEMGTPNQAMIDSSTASLASERINVLDKSTYVYDGIVTVMFLCNANPYESGIIDFRTNFTEWVAWMDRTGKTPVLSHERKTDGTITPYDWGNERMWAQNAVYIGQSDGNANVSVYGVDIHITYAVYFNV